MSDGTPVGPLLKTVFESILEVFLLCVAGYILARKGVLDRPTQKQLNKLNVSLFTPALLFSKVAFFLSPAKLRELWIIPIFFVVTTIVSMTVAFVLGWIFRLKRSQRSFAVAASMFMNSNSLPIALMQSLVVTVPGLKWGHDDNKNAMVGRALTYLVLYSTLGMVVRWSYGVRLLSQADPDPVPETEAPHSPLIDREETGFPPSAEEENALRQAHVKTSSDDEDDMPSITVQDTSRSSSSYLEPSKVFYSFPNSPYPSTQRLNPGGDPPSLDIGAETDDDDLLEIPVRRHTTEPTSSVWQSRRRRVRRWFKKTFKTIHEFMTVPLWAALASLLVACIQPLQHTLESHVQPIKGALNQAGNVSIPLTLVVLGAYFYSPPDPDASKLPSHDRRRTSMSTTMSQVSLVDSVRDMFRMKRRNRSVMSRAAEDKRPGETKTVVIAIVSRMVVTPLLLLPMMALSTRFNLQEVFEDPVFVVSNVLLFASPPALTLAQITQAASGDAFERLISRTIFWSYCVVTPPSTILFVVIGLILSKL